MQNVEMTVKGTKLTIVIDLAKEFGYSASGKTKIVASTRGNAPVPGGDGRTYIGINCYRYATPKSNGK